MSASRICQSCQKPIDPDAPLGLCPECLIKAGFPSGVDTKTGADARPGFLPPSVEELAALFPQLEILQLLGKGGMGAVYKARQKQLNRVVALKILPPGIGADPAFAERFTREAQALAQLNHPGIVTLYEFGHAAGMPFFLMEFVDGVNLGQALANDRVSPREALSIVPQVCDALQFAHDQGIIHRDIKPENILLDRRGRVKVADFGLAILAGDGAERGARAGSLTGSPTLTETGKVVGTPRYMSPEQLERPGEVDHRADIYALGVVFYQMLTGELPGKHAEAPSKKVHLDVRLDEIVLRALERKPELRFQQASELKTRVEMVAGAAAPPAAPPNAVLPGGRPRRFSRSVRLGFGIAIAVVACLVFGIALRLARGDRLSPAQTEVTAPLVRNEIPPAKSDPAQVVSQTIRNEVGRQLREAGATYDDLHVTVAMEQDSAPPFRVSYRGLRNFKADNGSAAGPDGAFIMESIGAGQWRGALAGKQFTVTVGSKDRIDLPFVNDPQVIGRWKSVDFVDAIAEFDPERPRTADLPFKGLTFLEHGKTPEAWWTWTKGVLIRQGDQTASHYEIRQIKGRPYLFLEWKSGDFTISGRKPAYYVLQSDR